MLINDVEEGSKSEHEKGAPRTGLVREEYSVLSQRIVKVGNDLRRSSSSTSNNRRSLRYTRINLVTCLKTKNSPSRMILWIWKFAFQYVHQCNNLAGCLSQALFSRSIPAQNCLEMWKSKLDTSPCFFLVSLLSPNSFFFVLFFCFWLCRQQVLHNNNLICLWGRGVGVIITIWI